MAGIGLLTPCETDKVALRGVRMRTHLAGMCQKTMVEQVFVNLEDRDIEAVYTFPLPDGAAVCGFEVATGDRILKGVLEEAGRAIDLYEQAIDDGEGGYLLEQERPDVFSIRVGGLKPSQAVLVRLEYLAELEVVGREAADDGELTTRGRLGAHHVPHLHHGRGGRNLHRLGRL